MFVGQYGKQEYAIEGMKSVLQNFHKFSDSVVGKTYNFWIRAQ